MNCIVVAPYAGPYHVGPHYKTDIESRHGRVAECSPQHTPQGEGNAIFLVKAANAHHLLIGALQELVRQVEISEAIDPLGHPLKNLAALRDAKSILEKITGRA